MAEGVERAAHMAHSFLKRGGKIRSNKSQGAHTFEFVVTVHRVRLETDVKVKHPEQEWVVVWTRGPKLAATHYAKMKGSLITWQQPLELLSTLFKQKDGGYEDKKCKFTLKQLKSNGKDHASLGRVKVNLSDHVTLDGRESVLELRLRDKKERIVGNMELTLACRYLSDYARDTGTLATGMTEGSGVSGVSAVSMEGSTQGDDGVNEAAPVPAIKNPGDASDDAEDHNEDYEEPMSPPHYGAAAAAPKFPTPSKQPARTPAATPVKAPGGESDEVAELRAALDDQWQENQKLKRQIEHLNAQLDSSKNCARLMTKYEVELLRTAEKNARIEAEVEERLTQGFVPFIQTLERELAKTKAELDEARSGKKPGLASTVKGLFKRDE